MLRILSETCCHPPALMPRLHLSLPSLSPRISLSFKPSLTPVSHISSGTFFCRHSIAHALRFRVVVVSFCVLLFVDKLSLVVVVVVVVVLVFFFQAVLEGEG